jgi:O-antigen/teichoic acid export membrane protein
MFDTTVVGWFSITVRVLQLPSTLVGSAVAQVFYARISREDRSDVAATTNAVFRSLVALGAGPMVLLAVGGQQLFALVFGEAWAEAGTYAQWLAPWLLLVFVTSPLSTLVFVRERQRAELVFQAVLLAARTATLVAGWALGSATLAIVMFGVGSAVLWGGYMLWLLRIGGVGVRQPLWWLTRDIAVALLLSTPLLVLSAAGVRGVAWAIAAIATLGVVLLRAQREIGALGHRI